jgi:hypothetical protein
MVWNNKKKVRKLTYNDKLKRIKWAKRLRSKFDARKNSIKWKWNGVIIRKTHYKGMNKVFERKMCPDDKRNTFSITTYYRKW